MFHFVFLLCCRQKYFVNKIQNGTHFCYTCMQEPKSLGLLPVMVWIHGGGFQCGAGISTYYGPDHLLDHDIVFVSFNYRLGMKILSHIFRLFYFSSFFK